MRPSKDHPKYHPVIATKFNNSFNNVPITANLVFTDSTYHYHSNDGLEFEVRDSSDPNVEGLNVEVDFRTVAVLL